MKMKERDEMICSSVYCFQVGPGGSSRQCCRLKICRGDYPVRVNRIAGPGAWTLKALRLFVLSRFSLSLFLTLPLFLPRSSSFSPASSLSLSFSRSSFFLTFSRSLSFSLSLSLVRSLSHARIHTHTLSFLSDVPVATRELIRVPPYSQVQLQKQIVLI